MKWLLLCIWILMCGHSFADPKYARLHTLENEKECVEHHACQNPCSVLFTARQRSESVQNNWETCFYEEKYFRIELAPNSESLNGIPKSVQKKIVTYLEKGCQTMGCSFQVYFSPHISPKISFEVYSVPNKAKEIFVQDVKSILEGKKVHPDLKYLIEQWCQLSKSYNDSLSLEEVEFRISDEKWSDDDIKNVLREGFHSLVELESHIVFYKIEMEDEPRYKIMTQTLRQDLRNFVQATPEHKQIGKSTKTNPWKKIIYHKLDYLETEAPIKSKNFWNYIWENSPPEKAISVRALRGILATVMTHIQKIEDHMIDITPACDWKGGKWIFGKQGCEGDVYIVCKDEKIQRIEQGCTV